MKHIRYYIITIITSIGVWVVSNLACKSDFKPHVRLPAFLNNYSEIGSKLLRTDTQSLVVAANFDSRYQLYQAGKNNFVKLKSLGNRDLFSPFLFNGKICGVFDNDGDEKYLPSDDFLRLLTDNSAIEFIKSLFGSQYLVLKFKHEKLLFLYTHDKQKSDTICLVEKKLHDVVAAENQKGLIVSLDDKLYYYDLQTNKKRKLAGDLPGEKRTPYFYQDDVYFANNALSEFWQIYKVNIKGGKSQLLLQKQQDLSMSKHDGKFLYFVQCDSNEYKLKRTNFMQTEEITTKGVVYNYEFMNLNKVGIIYSDFITPRTVIWYNEDTSTVQFMPGAQKNLGFSYEYTKPEENLSPAYIYHTGKAIEVKGVILNFHPGLHSDFSPRWDSTLMTLLHRGYMIVSPNYPMSAGYGKTYNRAGFKDAVFDMIAWKNHLQQKYRGLPLYFLSSSSGNLLMEECLEFDAKGVKKAVSLFGLYGRADYRSNVPVLHILGKNDPKVNYHARTELFRKLDKSTISFAGYENEGHWFRKRENLKNALVKIIGFLES